MIRLFLLMGNRKEYLVRVGDSMPKRKLDEKGPRDLTLMRVDIMDGIEIPMIHAWSVTDPTEMARVRQLEEMAEEVGITPEGTWDEARKKGEKILAKERRRSQKASPRS